MNIIFVNYTVNLDYASIHDNPYNFQKSNILTAHNW